MGPIILHLITRFIEEYNNKLDGNFVRDITSECLAGARINFIFHKIFKNAIMKVDPFENHDVQYLKQCGILVDADRYTLSVTALCPTGTRTRI